MRGYKTCEAQALGTIQAGSGEIEKKEMKSYDTA